jgi:acetyl-CoA synthetase
MTKGLHRDPARYEATYWSRWPDVWVQGDWASIDSDGYWYLHGRSDDTIQVAGKRLGPAEPESALVSHADVVEAAAIGVPDPVKGEALLVFVVLDEGASATPEMSAALTAHVADRLGQSFKPSSVVFVDALPKTRSGKVMRRALRAVATGTDPGDTTSMEDPSIMDRLRDTLAARAAATS